MAMADYPIPELGGLTPLQAADTRIWILSQSTASAVLQKPYR